MSTTVRTHSRPPSWSTLFPPSHSDPSPEWQLPKYSPAPQKEDVPASSPQHSSPPRTGYGRLWGKYGGFIVTALAVMTACSLAFSAVVLSRLPAACPTAEPDPLADLVGDREEVHLAVTPIEEPSEEETPAVPLSGAPSVEEDYRAYISQFVVGEPTESFEDNLRPEHKYITTWPSAGWTNDVMTYANLIHLALMTERIPILPPFAPSHLPLEAGFPPVSEVFDIPRLSRAIGIPILEWKDVKSEMSEEWDLLGCWSTWSTIRGSTRPSVVLPELKIDVSYTGIPEDFKLFPNDLNDPHVSLNKLMTLAFPSGRKSALEQHQPLPAAQSGISLEPSEQLLCYDFLYFTSVDTYYEWWQDWSPQWRLVGRHMHWTDRVERIAKEYLAEHFGAESTESIPPYIIVHARRGDFVGQCETGDRRCLPSHRQIAHRVEEMKHALSQQGVVTEHVLVTSDETDEEWWRIIWEMGYTSIDHTAFGTEARYGKWYEPILDAAFQSLASAVIGTERSTMSLLAERRAHDWHNAPGVILTFAYDE